MVIHLISGKIKSDCYYGDLDLGEFDQALRDKLLALSLDHKLETAPYSFDYSFEKSKYDYSEEELLSLNSPDFKINEVACSQRVVAPDGNIYFCPGFIELKEPLCNIDEFDEQKLAEDLEDLYLKKLYMCTSDDASDIRRFCLVKHKCDKKMCYYLNKKITGETRFPFSRFCAIKELRYENKVNKEELDTLLLVLNSLVKIGEAILYLGTSNPDFNVKNKANQIAKELNENINLMIKKIEGGNNGATS